MPHPVPMPSPIVPCAANESDQHICQWKVCTSSHGGKCLLDIDGGGEIKLARCESILLKAGKAGTLKLTASGGQIHIVGSHFDAYADRLTGCGSEWQLDGHVACSNNNLRAVEVAPEDRLHITLHGDKPAAK